MSSDEVTRRIQETRGLAQALEITGTPTFVFGDRMVRGYVALAQMRGLVEQMRATN
jgi:protein-disulfide isomerase